MTIVLNCFKSMLGDFIPDAKDSLYDNIDYSLTK